jgi:hypothetical protein
VRYHRRHCLRLESSALVCWGVLHLFHVFALCIGGDLMLTTDDFRKAVAALEFAKENLWRAEHQDLKSAHARTLNKFSELIKELEELKGKQAFAQIPVALEFEKLWSES